MSKQKQKSESVLYFFNAEKKGKKMIEKDKAQCLFLDSMSSLREHGGQT